MKKKWFVGTKSLTIGYFWQSTNKPLNQHPLTNKCIVLFCIAFLRFSCSTLVTLLVFRSVLVNLVHFRSCGSVDTRLYPLVRKFLPKSSLTCCKVWKTWLTVMSLRISKINDPHLRGAIRPHQTFAAQQATSVWGLQLRVYAALNFRRSATATTWYMMQMRVCGLKLLVYEALRN